MSKLPDLPKARPVAEVTPEAAALEQEPALRVGNREVVTDYYFHLGVADEAQKFQNKVFVRLGARKSTVFRNVSFPTPPSPQTMHFLESGSSAQSASALISLARPVNTSDDASRSGM
jgi:hypothetical protein